MKNHRHTLPRERSQTGKRPTALQIKEYRRGLEQLEQAIDHFAGTGPLRDDNLRDHLHWIYMDLYQEYMDFAERYPHQYQQAQKVQP